MTPLHNSYNNLSSWKFYRIGSNAVLKFNFTMNIVKAILTNVACLGLCILAYLNIKGEDKIWFLYIGAGTSLLVTVLAVYKHISERGKPGIFEFKKDSGEVEFPRMGKLIKNGFKTISFSHEIYQGRKNINSELNYVIDGERYPFMSHRGSLRKIADDFAKLGFVVNFYDDRKQ